MVRGLGWAEPVAVRDWNAGWAWPGLGRGAGGGGGHAARPGSRASLGRRGRPGSLAARDDAAYTGPRTCGTARRLRDSEYDHGSAWPRSRGSVTVRRHSGTRTCMESRSRPARQPGSPARTWCRTSVEHRHTRCRAMAMAVPWSAKPWSRCSPARAARSDAADAEPTRTLRSDGGAYSPSHLFRVRAGRRPVAEPHRLGHLKLQSPQSALGFRFLSESLARQRQLRGLQLSHLPARSYAALVSPRRPGGSSPGPPARTRRRRRAPRPLP